MTTVEPLMPSGCPEFDRARALLADGREDEALDWFEIASSTSDEAPVRASACAYAAAVLLAKGRPWEVASWAELVRANAGSRDLAALLEAAALLQLDDAERALELLDGASEPDDPWFPCSATVVRVVRAHVQYLLDDKDAATSEVLDVFAAEPYSPDVWDAFARLVAETDFDPAEVVARVPDERVLDVIAALRTSEPSGVARIVELIWERSPGDARVLALVPRFAAKLDAVEAMQWSARMRAAGMGRTCPLLARADDVAVDARERVRAAALAYASFGDSRARDALELGVRALAEEELDDVLTEVWSLAPALADSVVVAAATSTRRSLRLAAGLYAGGAVDEAYAVLVHGLAMEDAEELTTDEIIDLLPVPALEALAHAAEVRGEDDVAGILEAVAVAATAQE